MEAIPIAYEKPELCGPCGGNCCKAYPGSCMPIDFGLPDTKSLTKAIKGGTFAIDWWEGDPRDGQDDLSQAYFVRPATKGQEGKTFDGSWGGECHFLTEKGCSLSTVDRPSGCRLLEPWPNHECQTHGADKQDSAIAWLPYTDLLDSFGD